LIPVISTSGLFLSKPVARFAVGIVANQANVAIGMDAEHQAYGLLRGNVYAHEKHYMAVAELNADGTETDRDDPRSVHFGLFENSSTGVRAVGATRLIIKEADDAGPLPIEEHYPYIFETAAAPKGSLEVSRLISRHESPHIQRKLKWLLFAVSAAYIVENQLGPVYGILEQSIEVALHREGMPMITLGEPVLIEEFNSVNVPIRIDMTSLEDRLTSQMPELFETCRRIENGFVLLDASTIADEAETIG